MSLGEVYLNTGAAYSPAGNSWTVLSTNSAPSGRTDHSSIWTGTQMIIWAGIAPSDTTLLVEDNTGGRLTFPANTWVVTTTNSAPTNRASHTAVWTGSTMVVFGGLGNGTYDFFNSGGRYNPVANSWLATSTTGAPAPRKSHTAIWTGTEMIVWGGEDTLSYFADGGRYNPSTDSWTAVNQIGAPAVRSGHTAVWTGSEMIIWGGENFISSSYSVLNTMGRYTPAANLWGTPPATTLTNPAAGTKILALAGIALGADASDEDGSVTQVAFFANGAPAGTANAAPYTRLWTNDGLGFFTLTAVATDNSGLMSTSAPVVVESVLKPQMLISQTNPGYVLTLLCETNRTYRVDYSSNLAAWLPLVTNVATDGTFSFTNDVGSEITKRFYRAVP